MKKSVCTVIKDLLRNLTETDTLQALIILETTTLPDELNDDNENDHVPTMVDENNQCGSGNVNINSESNEGEKDSSSIEEDSSGAEDADFSVESLPLQSTFVEDKIDRDSIEESVVEPVCSEECSSLQSILLMEINERSKEKQIEQAQKFLK